MKIAVTGATSMIGLAIIKYAQSLGDEVVAIVRKNSANIGRLKELKDIKVLECDISDYRTFKTDEKADVFFHLSWDKTSPNNRDDVETQLANVSYSLDALSLANKMGCKKFVGAGSQAEFGIKNTNLNGDMPVDPLTAYGICKFTAGKLTKLKAEKLQIEHNWVRILSTYGINDSKTSLISYIIDCFLKGQSPELSPCLQMWDYMFEDDMGKAIYLVGKNGISGKTYVLGSGKGVPLKNYVEIAKRISGSDVEIKYGAKPYYKNQTDYLVADISELTKDTGFVPSISFEEGIEKIIKSKEK